MTSKDLSRRRRALGSVGGVATRVVAAMLLVPTMVIPVMLTALLLVTMLVAMLMAMLLVAMAVMVTPTLVEAVMVFAIVVVPLQSGCIDKMCHGRLAPIPIRSLIQDIRKIHSAPLTVHNLHPWHKSSHAETALER